MAKFVVLSWKSRATFLDDVASSLREMEQKLRLGEIPTHAGNRLKRVLRRYDLVMAQAPVTEEDRAKLQAFNVQIRQSHISGQAEDDFLRGKIRDRPLLDRNEALDAIVRVAARIEGDALSLRAKSAN